MNLRRWAGLCLLVLGLFLAFISWPGQGSSAAPPSAVETPVDLPSIVEASPSPDHTSMKPSQSASPSPIRAASPSQPRVGSAEPTKLVIPGVLKASFGDPIDPIGGKNGVLEPPGFTDVYRWRDRGRPGTQTKDTVYVLGHTFRHGNGVFDRLQKEVKPGQSIFLTTKKGNLQYKVTKTHLYPKHSIQKADEVYDSVPGQLILIGCFLNADGSRQDRNFVVFAQLVGAKPN